MLYMAFSLFPVVGFYSWFKQCWNIPWLDTCVRCSLLFMCLRIPGSGQFFYQLGLTILCVWLFPHSEASSWSRFVSLYQSSIKLELIVRENAVPQCLACTGVQQVSETWRQAPGMENWVAWAVLAGELGLLSVAQKQLPAGKQELLVGSALRAFVWQSTSYLVRVCVSSAFMQVWKRFC